ncbi:MAG: aromatic hydrocarbon degradation protein [Chlorobiaceae bacterium]|nr:aromatic hydrocarbon degradation protein [Chlorobiaceae bacterium]NTV60996.1 aromatic hydrocarbon degradation protein [Chlorobiaceae bacterium]
MIRKTACSAAALLVLAGTTPAFATNGMNLEGYGAKSLAMGGTGMAYDTGNSAVMNNPATLGFMEEGSSEIGIGIRGLHPDVSLSYGPYTEKSGATAFYMPSLSYMRRDGRISWGAAVLSQGGMGTDFGSDSQIFAGGLSMMGSMVPMSGESIRTEVGVGRVMFPIAYHLTENTTIGGSLDVVWVGMDLQMDMDGDHFGRMMTGVGGSVGGSMAATLGSMLSPSGPITDINYARFDFSNASQWTGEAKGYGAGFKLGFTHRFSKEFSIGAVYHSQTSISDLETSKAVLAFEAQMGSTPFYQSVTGTIKVHDFEWPATFAAGVAFRPSDRLIVACDVKHINWSSVMQRLFMTFTADNTVSNGPFAGQTLDVKMTQDWKDQTVWALGLQYMATDRLALRAGASFSGNPVPDLYLNPLFPAITKDHYTCGLGYRLSKVSSIAAAFSWAPEVKTVNGDGMVITHGQSNWALNYVYQL